MFNLESLNDYEFEILCKDILEKILDIELYTFAKGRDGGIDICDAKTYPTIIAQAKHYYKSSFQQLLSSLKKEVDRVGENCACINNKRIVFHILTKKILCMYKSIIDAKK